MPPWKQILIAFRSGFVAYLGTTLILTTILSAMWASQTEFPGHSHAPGTEDHVHLLQEVGLSAPASVVLAVILTSLPAAPVRADRRPEFFRPAPRRRSDLARAPPGSRRLPKFA